MALVPFCMTHDKLSAWNSRRSDANIKHLAQICFISVVSTISPGRTHVNALFKSETVVSYLACLVVISVFDAKMSSKSLSIAMVLTCCENYSPVDNRLYPWSLTNGSPRRTLINFSPSSTFQCSRALSFCPEASVERDLSFLEVCFYALLGPTLVAER